MVRQQTITGRNVIDSAAIDTLAGRLQGTITLPNSPSYDQARAVWNGMIDRYPALIVHCETSGDVVAAIGFARELGLPVAIRGGGHSVAGHSTCDDGIVVDLSPMKDIAIDPEAQTARAGAGVTWGELDAASQAHGLATPGGVFSDTGIAGLTLGGGYGWLRNLHGLSCDNLISAEVVTADGRIVHASEQENPDLLWGLRGGGGNFGVVATFEYRLHKVGPEVYFAFCFHDGDGENTQRAIEHYVGYTENAPDEVSTIAVCGIIPPVDEMFPKDIQNRHYVVLAGMYAGAPDEGAKVLRPLRDFAEPLIDFSGTMPYVEAQQVFDEDYPDGMRYYWKSTNLTRIDENAIKLIAEHALRQPSPLSTTDLWHVGGAVTETPETGSAFGGRQALFLLNMEANWEDEADDAANMQWAREAVDALAEYSDGSSYVNFAGFHEEGDKMARSVYASQHERMVQLKAKYDPENMFKLNPNIKPMDMT